MIKATRPLEYVCFFPMEVPSQEGDVYFFLFLDLYSEFLINTGMEHSENAGAVLKHLDLLMQHPEFKRHRDTGFTLVLHKYHELEKDINHIIQPFKGRFIVDDDLVAEKMFPVMNHLFKTISQIKKP